MTGVSSSCGACKFLRRKCKSDCVFAPYFCYDQAAIHFAAVHKVFGASNVSKLLLHLPVNNRGEAAITITYEALARDRDPIYGCVSHIFALQQQVANLQDEIKILSNQMANFSIGNPSCVNSRAINDNSRLQISTQYDAINIQQCLNHQATLLSHKEVRNVNAAFDSPTSTQFPPSYEWDVDPTMLDRVLAGMAHDPDSCAWYSSLNNEGNTKIY